MTRNQQLKLKRGHSTKAERKFMDLLNKLHIPFKAKVLVWGREIDFIVGGYAIEIDGHKQDSNKNKMLLENGYIPVHLSNRESLLNLEQWLKKIT